MMPLSFPYYGWVCEACGARGYGDSLGLRDHLARCQQYQKYEADKLASGKTNKGEVEADRARVFELVYLAWIQSGNLIIHEGKWDPSIIETIVTAAETLIAERDKFAKGEK